jgi:aspartate aminotransferase-like enzyme
MLLGIAYSTWGSSDLKGEAIGEFRQALDLNPRLVQVRFFLAHLYLDLGRLARLQDQRNTPFTPAVHAYYALVEALREFADQGGRLARHKRYAALAEQVRAGLAALADQDVAAVEREDGVHAVRAHVGVVELPAE